MKDYNNKQAKQTFIKAVIMQKEIDSNIDLKGFEMSLDGIKNKKEIATMLIRKTSIRKICNFTINRDHSNKK